MPRKKRPKLTFKAKLIRIKNAGIKTATPVQKTTDETDDLPDLNERIKRVLQIFDQHEQKKDTMLYFVMYDIENDKVRNHIAKFLIRKGCTRVQKSIYLADTQRQVYAEIHKTLKEVQEVYDNHDSIFLVPVSSDDLRAMKIIGENIDLDLITGNKNTLFF
ncbi:MAG: CRISPR-associated endonuclease Cas2 [Lewinellaceae bacterium]|nr:CRISPR-associated endonuclease Cas2 [Lewinellaceae bacterium]